MMKISLLTVLATAMAVSQIAHSANNITASSAGTKPSIANPNQRVKIMKIRLTANGKTITATLADNPTSRDFFSLLPMTATLEDYVATEKISYLPRKLSTEGAPSGTDPAVGDIAYYAPWGNLAIFYKDSGYARGLIKLGEIDSGVEALDAAGSFRVTIEAVDHSNKSTP